MLNLEYFESSVIHEAHHIFNKKPDMLLALKLLNKLK